MVSSFFDELCAENHDLHSASLNHPVVLSISDGTLEETTFRFYVEQDYAFLRRYVRVIARAVDAAPDLATADTLAELLHGTLSTEIGALRELYAAFGGNPGELDNIVPAPTCQAYTDHLLACATDRNLSLILAAVLPCQWGYGEIGRHLHTRGLPDDHRYARWIEEYASEEYAHLVRWAITTLDSLAERDSAEIRARSRTAFRLSSHYELRFWQMAANQESWALPRTEVLSH